MILQSLTKYYELLAEKSESGELQGKDQVSRPGWSAAKVSYALCLNPDGSIQSVTILKEQINQGNKTVLLPVTRQVPAPVKRTAGISANFLCDNSKYILGIDKDGSNDRTRECFKAAKAKHLEILEGIDNEPANAVKSFFLKWDPDQAKKDSEVTLLWDDLTDGGNIIFYINGLFADEDDQIRDNWMKNYQSAGDSVKGICLITGEKTDIARIHTAIKGVYGAQSSGAALVSFNAPAFESYGKEQSYNAPIGNHAMFAYTTALNYLLSHRDYVKQIGDTTVIFWSEDADVKCQDLFMAASEPTKDNQKLLHDLFDELAKGKAVNVTGIEGDINLDQKFYILGLSPNAARLAVRFFYEDNFGDILRHLKEHYDRMNIIRPASDDIEYLGIWRMLQETVNKKSRDKKPNESMAGRVFECILSGGRYPESLYTTVLARIRAEQDDPDSYNYKITRGRAAIIKAYLLRNTSLLNEKEETFVSLEENCNDRAYVLGREFAVLEEIQEAANPGINATIKDRYFNSACTTPAIVFPTLFRLKNSHIRKLSTGMAVYYEKLLTQLQSMLPADGYPGRLSMKEQGQFIIGYYHQNEKRYEKKEDK